MQNSEPSAVAARPRPAPLEKPTSERMSKTVMPNTVRSSMPDPFKAAADSAPNIKLPSLRSSKLPPSVALALQPKVERAISLHLSDILEQLPIGHIKPAHTFDPAQPILLKASEIEKGMASGKPTVSLATIYEQVPEIFLRNVPPDDTTHIGLPFDKVLDQFQNVHVREDQEEENDVPQMDTPILQCTIEDTKRFGTTMPTLQTSAHPPVRVEPATARTLSSAEPEGVLHEKIASATTPRGIPLNLSTSPSVGPRPSTTDPVSPIRIPFKLPPNGTGGAASERVPASSGPPVPTSVSKNGGPARIPFKVSAPCDDLKPKLTLVPGVAGPEEKEPEEPVAAAVTAEVKISLGLRAVLRDMPAFQLNGSPDAVADDARIELPLALVQSQLASGRIAIPAKTFRDAMPENHRELVVVDDAQSPVLLPLQEVLKNLPSTVLKMREDQEDVDATASFETPFSIKAAEDAKRLSGGTPAAEKKPDEPEVPVKDSSEAKPSETTASAETAAPFAVETKPESKIDEKSEITGIKVEEKEQEVSKPEANETIEAKPEATLDTNTTAKDVVSRASGLSGVAACSVTFEDGLSLAGNLPDDVQVGGLCAMAPSVLQRINRHTVDTKLGPLISMTLHCRESQMSFFMKGSVCLTVLHAGGDLASETHNKLADMANDLSRIYSQPEAVHVDH